MPVIVVGMNDPSGRGALLTDEPGSAGWRLWQLSGMTRELYEETFVRINLVDGATWDASRAEVGAINLMLSLSTRDRDERPIVVLGREAEKAFRKVLTSPPPSNFYFVPHPSGKNLYYNLLRNRARVSRLLRKLAGIS